MLLIVILILSSVSIMPHAGSVIIGRRETCTNEGEEVKVDNIKDSSCFHCLCKNGFVECLQGCPKTDGCFHLIEKPKNGCCSKCKGCMYEGTEYASDTEWTDPLDPCRILRCEAGIVTESDMECYTPCDHPLPPRPGQCCPVCLGCRINGQRVTEERDVTIPEDPCLKCHCESGRMTCSKRACPVLQCSKLNQYHAPGECCPQCKGTRTRFPSASGCILERNYLTFGQQIKIENGCTQCRCTGNGTSICHRSTCPVLLCPQEQQKISPGDCCPQCPLVEETRTTCYFMGKTYQDGESWQLDACKSCECVDGRIQCAMDKCPPRNVPCPPNHKLVHPPGQCCPKCVESDGVCTVFGDPHYKTFDGRFYSFQGSCKYQLVADCADHAFSIRVTNDGKKTRTSAWTKTVSIKIKDLKINLGQKKRIKVNGKRITIPFNLEDRVKIEKSDDLVLVTTHIGIKILWDGISFLEITAATKYKGKLCGLCGNFNSIGRDDLITRRGKLLNDTEIWKFATSWRVGGKKACGREHDIIKSKERVCSRAPKWTQHLCLPLLRNKFGNCDKKINPDKYYRACLMDMCECPDGRCFCESFTAYAHECQRLGVQLPDWKAQTNCLSNSTLPIVALQKNLAKSMPLPLLAYGNSNSNKLFIKPTGNKRRATKKPNLIQPPKRPKNPKTRGPPPPLINN